MEAFETIRDSAARLHNELVSGGVDALKPMALVEAALSRLGLEVFWLTSGDPALKGARALFDEQSGSIFCERVTDIGERALLVGHEIGHVRVHATSSWCDAHDIDPSRSTEAAPVGLQRVEDYGVRERRELQANVFAREFLLPRTLARQLYLENELRAGAIAERMTLPKNLVRQQLFDALLLPVTASKTGWTRDPLPGNDLTQAINGIDPIGQKIVGFYPQPINSAVSSDWRASGLGANNSTEYSSRIDHNIGLNTRLYGRFSYKKEFKDESAPYLGTSDPAGPGQRNPNNRYSIAFGVSHVFTPTFTVSGNLGLVHWTEGNDVQSGGFKPSSLGLPTSLDAVSAEYPVIAALGYVGQGPQAGAAQGAFPRGATTGSLDFVKIHGKHQVSFGYMGVALDENGGRIHPTQFDFDKTFTGATDGSTVTPNTGDAIAAILLGVPLTRGNATGVAVSQISRAWLHGVYVQDDWKVTRKLTLNIGLRWEVPLAITERLDRLARFDYNATNPISSAVGASYQGQLVFAGSGDRGQYNTNYKEFAPRFGFAYQLMPKLVMRGGYGVFFPRQYPGVPTIPGFAADTPYVATTNGVGPCAGCSLRNAFTSGLVPVVGKSLGGLTNVAFDVTAVSPSRKAYYTQQWSYGLQYAPSPKDLLELSYVGNHSVHVVTSGSNLNQLPTKYFSMGTALNTLVANPFFGHVAASGCGLDQPTVRQGQLLRPHPEFCNINENLIPGGDGRYNALDFSFTHRVSNSLTLMASYTFSKFLDNIGGPTTWANTSGAFSENIRDVYNLAAEKSVDPNDVAHGFVLSYVYELPVGQGRKYGNGMNPVLNAVAGGWQTSGIVALKGGFPLRINGPNTGLGGFGVGQNVNIIGNYHVANQIRTQWFNPAAFAQPTQITNLGNAPRYFSDLRSPGYKNIERLVIAT